MKLIYLYDAICGWCYGFTPAILQLQQEYGDKMEFDIMSGGMIIGDNRRPFSTMAAYIQGAHKRVEEMTGVTFGQPFLEQLLPSEEIIDSEKPAVALTVFKQYQPAKALSFAHDMQVALNYHGKSLNNDDTYRELLEPYGIDADEFLQKMQLEDNRYATQQEFQLIQNWGITGFPAAIFDNGEQLYLIARGFTPIEQLRETITKIMAEPTA